MKLTTPDDMKLDVNIESDLLAKEFERLLKIEPLGKKNYFLIVNQEYSEEACNIVKRRYEEAGWKDVKCRSLEDRSSYTTSILLNR